MFFEAFSPEIVYDSNMLEHQTNPHFNAYEKHIIVVILFVSALLGLGSEADEYKTEQNCLFRSRKLFGDILLYNKSSAFILWN